MQAGLQRLAGLMSDGGIADRNPLSSLSFCCLDAETIKSQTDALVQFRKGQLRAMNPVHADGRLIRRYVLVFHLCLWGLDGAAVGSRSYSIERQLTILASPHRYTRNRDEHWFQAGVDGLSHARELYHPFRILF